MADALWSPEELEAQQGAIGLPRPYTPEPDDVVRLFEALDAADPGEVDTLIDAVENAMVVATRLNPELYLVELTPAHQFGPREYFRQLAIPAGTLVTSRRHLTNHTCFVTAGSITIWSLETGVKHITAPYVFESSAGSRRIGIAHEDTVWTTVHDNPGDEQDVRAIEAVLYAPYVKPEERPEVLAAIAAIDAGEPLVIPAGEEAQ